MDHIHILVIFFCCLFLFDLKLPSNFCYYFINNTEKIRSFFFLTFSLRKIRRKKYMSEIKISFQRNKKPSSIIIISHFEV